MLLQFKVNRPLSHVLDHLSVAELIVRTHPIIFAVDHIIDHTYLIKETAPIGPFKRTFSYEAEILSLPDQGHVRILAKINNLVKLNMEFSLTETFGETHILESVTIKSVLPISGLLKKTVEKQHKIWFENIAVAQDNT